MADFNKPGMVNVNTGSVVFFDEGGVMLRCGFLNESLSINFTFPLIGPDGTKVYKNAPFESCILTKDRVAAMYDIIIRKVLGAVESKRNYNGGVFNNNKKDSVFEIKVENGNIFALFHKEIDENRIPKKSVCFKFSKTPIIENFNPAGGDFEIPEVDANFALFVKLIEGFLLTTNNSGAHSGKMTNKYSVDKVLSQISDIAAKLGISPAPSFNSNGNYNGSQSNRGFDAGVQGAYQEADSLSSILQ